MNTPTARQQWIFEQLESNDGLTFGECFSKYLVKYSKTEQTFAKDWNKATIRHKALQQAKEKAISDTMVGEAVQAAQNGLKSKYERMARLQTEIERMEGELESGRTVETVERGGKAVAFERDITIQERSLIRRTMQAFHSEISKMAGEYAPIKQEHAGKDGNALPASVSVTILSSSPPITSEDDISE